MIKSNNFDKFKKASLAALVIASSFSDKKINAETYKSGEENISSEYIFKNSFESISEEFDQFKLNDTQKREIALVVLMDNFNKDDGFNTLVDVNNSDNSLVKIWDEYKNLMSEYAGSHDEVMGELINKNLPNVTPDSVVVKARRDDMLRVSTKDYEAEKEDLKISAGTFGVKNRKSNAYCKIQYYKGKKGRSCVLNTGSGDYLSGLTKAMILYRDQNIKSNSKNISR